jgi:hypothetical protein
MRHGTVDLLAGFRVQDGRVCGIWQACVHGCDPSIEFE